MNNRYIQQRNNMSEWFRRLIHREWKYSAIGFGVATLLMMLTTGLMLDKVSWHTMMVMSGCIGALAIIFVIICAIYYCKVYKDYISHRFDPRKFI